MENPNLATVEFFKRVSDKTAEITAKDPNQ